MSEKVHRIDLNAPIVAGKSAAGFMLGMHKNNLSKEVLNLFTVTEIVNEHVKDLSLYKYYTEEVTLFFKDDKLSQIGLFNNYKGTVYNELGLGSVVKDFETVFGDMVEGDEDQLVFSNLKGLCFEVDSSTYTSANWKVEIPKQKVTEIYIYEEY